MLGEWWAPLILRDVWVGISHFGQLQRDLGISRKVLAERLKWLTDQGILDKREYSSHPPRFEYVLTAKGRDLSDVLLTLAAWGDRHVYGGLGGPTEFTHRACGCRFTARLTCEACGGALEPGGLSRHEGPTTATVAEVMAIAKRA